jgi:hypothetical protein
MSLRGLGGGGRISQMGMRTAIPLSVIFVLATIPLSAQNVPSRRQTRAVVDPVELSGPPKKPIVVTPAKRAFAHPHSRQLCSPRNRGRHRSRMQRNRLYMQTKLTGLRFPFRSVGRDTPFLLVSGAEGYTNQTERVNQREWNEVPRLRSGTRFGRKRPHAKTSRSWS